MSKKALIIVDMLNDFLDERGALFCGLQARTIIPFVRQRQANYRRHGRMVIYLQDSHDVDDREFEKFPRHCITHSWGSEIIPELTPLPGEIIIPKQRYSGFYGTNLEDLLLRAAVEEIEVNGVCTSICVMDTVGGLADRDYLIKVAAEGVADFNLEFHNFALKRMQQLYGAEIL
ncbi:MAG: cysteine hydrolase [Deltaproteobacteria bacterium]|nr:cysteine hydrolase [Deltaproteobacteria bacterium]